MFRKKEVALTQVHNKPFTYLNCAPGLRGDALIVEQAMHGLAQGNGTKYMPEDEQARLLYDALVQDGFPADKAWTGFIHMQGGFRNLPQPIMEDRGLILKALTAPNTSQGLARCVFPRYPRPAYADEKPFIARYRSDEEVVYHLVVRAHIYLNAFDERFASDRAFVLKCLEAYPFAILGAPAFSGDAELIMKALRGLTEKFDLRPAVLSLFHSYIGGSLYKDVGFVTSLVDGGWADATLGSDIVVMEKGLGQLLSDPSSAEQLVLRDVRFLNHIPGELCRSREFLERVAMLRPEVCFMCRTTDLLGQDDERAALLLEALKDAASRGYTLFASADSRPLFHTLTDNGRVLPLTDRSDVAFALIENNPSLAVFCAYQQAHDLDWYKAVCGKEPVFIDRVRISDDFFTQSEFHDLALHTVSADGNALYNIGWCCWHAVNAGNKNDDEDLDWDADEAVCRMYMPRDVQLAAVKQTSRALMFCTKDCQDDREFALLGKTHDDFKCLSERLRSDPDIVSHYMARDPESIRYAGLDFLLSLYAAQRTEP